MLVIMNNDATDEEVRRVEDRIEELGYRARPMPGKLRTAIGIVGNDGPVDGARFQDLPGVREVIHVTRPFKLVSREWQPESSRIAVSESVVFGGGSAPIIAGPCSVESRDQILEAALAVQSAGASMLRGGAFKPRTSPYSFQGLGLKGLELLAEVRDHTGLPIVTEAVDPDGVDPVAELADMIQVGARNMQNYSLLKRVGQSGKPVLLKRGISATITELLLSAEYILAEGNERVVLCERGIRGFDQTTRNVLDLAAIPVIQRLSHLPVIADPSHGTGDRQLVPAMARAALAAGADGLMIEVHPQPSRALSDGSQSLSPDQFSELMKDLAAAARVSGREIAGKGAVVGA